MEELPDKPKYLIPEKFYYWVDTNSDMVIMTLNSNPPKVKAYFSNEYIAKRCNWVPLDTSEVTCSH